MNMSTHTLCVMGGGGWYLEHRALMPASRNQVGKDASLSNIMPAVIHEGPLRM